MSGYKAAKLSCIHLRKEQKEILFSYINTDSFLTGLLLYEHFVIDDGFRN